MELHNLTCLKNLLVCKPNNITGGVNGKQVSDWYDSDFRQNTMGYDYSVVLKPGLSGGSLTVEEFIIDGRKYLFKLNYSEAELVPTRYDDGTIEYTKYDARLYFLSLLDNEQSNHYACIYVIIHNGGNYGLIQGFTNKFLCSGYRIGERINLLSERGQGYYLMNGLIQYCYKYRNVLGIDRLELNDESRYECKPKVNIDLLYSNILCGKLPYYMKFGFQPIERSTNEKIKYNLNVVRDMVVTSELLSKLEKIAKRYGQSKLPNNIVTIVKGSIGGKLSDCMSRILYEDCIFYAMIYRLLFIKLKLSEFTEGETAFELYL